MTEKNDVLLYDAVIVRQNKSNHIYHNVEKVYINYL